MQVVAAERVVLIDSVCVMERETGELREREREREKEIVCEIM